MLCYVEVSGSAVPDSAVPGCGVSDYLFVSFKVRGYRLEDVTKPQLVLKLIPTASCQEPKPVPSPTEIQCSMFTWFHPYQSPEACEGMSNPSNWNHRPDMWSPEHCIRSATDRVWFVDIGGRLFSWVPNCPRINSEMLKYVYCSHAHTCKRSFMVRICLPAGWVKINDANA